MVKRSFTWIYIPIVLLIVGGLISLGAAFYLLLNASAAATGQDSQANPTNDSLLELPTASSIQEPSDNPSAQLTQPAPSSALDEALTTPLPSPGSATATPQAISITIIDGENQRVLETRKKNVADAILDAGVLTGPDDQIDPAPDTPIVPGMVIRISRPIPLSIQADGQIFHIHSTQTSVAAVLTDLGISLGENDIVTPGLDETVQAGDTIDIQRIAADVFFIDEEIPYQTVYQPSPDLDLDTKAALSPGSPGILRRQVRIIYEDGQEVERIVENEWVEKEAVNEVIGYGTKVNLGSVDTAEGPREYWRIVRMRVTAYTAASSGKPPDHPSYGITASGLPAGTGIVAIDPNVVPFRSEVFVPGYGIGFAGDTGGGVKGRWIDLGYDEDELVAWNGYVDVYYLTPVPDEINYLIPEVLP